MKTKPKIIAVVGPTASGKSDLAVTLAEAFGGEVVSADSRQVYRDLDIGTGKITREEMRGIPHHLLDVVSPEHVFSVAQYKKQADAAIRDILARGKLPLLCGGTGFYIQAITDGIILPEVKPNPTLRKKLSLLSTSELTARLNACDPERVKTIDAHNPHRLIRAIEIAEALGRVPPIQKKPEYETLFIGIDVPMDRLRERIRKRLFMRIKGGMIDEVAMLHARGLSWERMDELGLEYRFTALYLQKKLIKEDYLRNLETEIVHYAKRQYTWLRSNKRIRWVPLWGAGIARTIAEDFLKKNAPDTSGA